jgi:hypothetical protein
LFDKTQTLSIPSFHHSIIPTNMKSYLSLFILTICSLSILHAQEEVNTHIASGRSSYASGDLENARFELQSALAELDIVIAKRILEEMPDEWGGLSPEEGADEYNGVSLGFTGLFVNRVYGDPYGKHIDVNIVSNSPLLGSLNTFLNNPIMAGMSGRKRIKLDGYKGSMEELSDGNYQVNIPFGNSLMDIQFYDMGDENEVTGLMNQFPVGKVIELAK